MNKKLFCFSPAPVFINKVMRIIGKYFSVCFFSLILVCGSGCFILTSSSCGDEEYEPLRSLKYPLTAPVMVLLLNQSPDKVHLWVNPTSGFEGETINPGNQLVTDEHRVKIIYLYWAYEGAPVTLSVSMGQNGKTLKTVSCLVEPDENLLFQMDQYTAVYEAYDGEAGKLILADANSTVVARSN